MSGDPLLLLHGFPLDRGMWAEQVAALSGTVRCIAPDLRGFGSAALTESGGAWTMDDYARDVVALLDSLGVARVRVAGFSMGGYVAFALWRLHPERVSALALVDTRAGADTAEGRTKRDEMIALARQGGADAVAERQIAGLVGKTTREERPGVVTAAMEMMRRAPVAGIVAALQAMRDRPDSTPLLPTITVPTVVIVGDEDVLTPAKDARILADGIPGARLEVVARAGHLAPMEQPHVVTELLRTGLDFTPGG
jgi:3-oxoadipate enol-lactonase